MKQTQSHLKEGIWTAMLAYLRFLTDPNIVGVEKMATTLPPAEYLDYDAKELPDLIQGNNVMSDSNIFAATPGFCF